VAIIPSPSQCTLSCIYNRFQKRTNHDGFLTHQICKYLTFETKYNFYVMLIAIPILTGTICHTRNPENTVINIQITSLHCTILQTTQQIMILATS